MIRVLVVDDQVLVRAGFRSILEKQPDIDVVGEAGDGIEAVYQARSLRPDLVLMDIRMPRQDGLSATEQLMASETPPRIVVLTTFDADEYVYAALRAGAIGFLLKDISPEDLAAAVRNAMSGDSMLSPRITKRLIESYVRSPAPTEGVPESLRGLTGRELDVLRELATGATNTEIGKRLSLAETTVKTHLAHIFTKLDVRDRVQAVVLAYETGLVRPSA
ncbi:response regulator [Nonomuraea maritima]|uniref:response regulator n=1 Tax=Nonomuraea maritima TaxID=683260 RepID=UPI003721CCC2